MTELRQLFYVSRVTRPIAESEVREILRVSQRNNRQRDFTGCLMYSGRHFAQTLEGEPVALSELAGRIAADPRHGELKMLIDRSVQVRQCPDWSMGFLYNLDLADELEAMFAAGPLETERAEQFMSKLRADSVMGSL